MDDTLWQQAAFSSKQLDSAPFVDPGSLSSLSPPEQQSDESSSPSSGDDIQVRPSPAKRQQQQQQQSERVSAQQQQTATMPIHKVARGSPDTSHESHGKRQGADIAHGALKDRKPLASSRRESRGSDAPHSHAALLDDPSAVADDAFEDDDAGGDPKSRKGAKTSERRKQQNRAAQRAFRERKEKVGLPGLARATSLTIFVHSTCKSSRPVCTTSRSSRPKRTARTAIFATSSPSASPPIVLIEWPRANMPLPASVRRMSV